jgi:hypothetical protein
MKIGNLKKIGTTLVLTPALLAATMPAGAQELHRRGDDRGRYQQRYEGRDHGRDVHRDYRPEYRGDGYYVHDDGIGPGKGAAIGAVSGVILGALVGGGKGAVIGGAAGAGVGAIAGQASQDRRYNYGY